MQKRKTKMAKKKFRIGELARELEIKKFVIRFWEKEFGLQATRSEGGQRFYTANDLKVFQTIKDLLYTQGFTIAGAKLRLNSTQKVQTVTAAQRGTTLQTVEYRTSKEVLKTIKDLKKKLLLLQELVS